MFNSVRHKNTLEKCSLENTLLQAVLKDRRSPRLSQVDIEDFCFKPLLLQCLAMQPFLNSFSILSFHTGDCFADVLKTKKKRKKTSDTCVKRTK